MQPKAPLILISGLLCDEALWAHQVKSLKNIADCHVADTTRHDRIELVARDVLAMAPPRFALAGLSMGGYVAFEILRQAPQRVLRLCLLDTTARPDTAEQKERRKLLLAMARTGKFRGVTPRLLPMLIYPDRLRDAPLTETVMGMAERMGPEVFQRQQMAILHRVDSRPTLGAIACPTQVIGGMQDTLTPPDLLREIANGISGARLDLIERCGHLAPLERPDEVGALMARWLTA
ncbi:MAG: alpha/beta fold hydrolase [Bdellovibrionales bacterium]